MTNDEVALRGPQAGTQSILASYPPSSTYLTPAWRALGCASRLNGIGGAVSRLPLRNENWVCIIIGGPQTGHALFRSLNAHAGSALSYLSPASVCLMSLEEPRSSVWSAVL